jgi:hypothetical protein
VAGKPAEVLAAHRAAEKGQVERQVAIVRDHPEHPAGPRQTEDHDVERSTGWATAAGFVPWTGRSPAALPVSR